MSEEEQQPKRSLLKIYYKPDIPQDIQDEQIRQILTNWLEGPGKGFRITKLETNQPDTEEEATPLPEKKQRKE